MEKKAIRFLLSVHLLSVDKVWRKLNYTPIKTDRLYLWSLGQWTPHNPAWGKKKGRGEEGKRGREEERRSGTPHQTINSTVQWGKSALKMVVKAGVAFLVASRCTKTDPKRNENFGFGLIIYTNRKVSYRLRLGSKTEPIVQMSTLYESQSETNW